MNEMVTIRCESLCKSFGGLHALAGVSISFQSPGITAIIGPNGAGKTTLLNVLTGFLRPDSGEMFLSGARLTHLPPHMIAHLGIGRTFQDLRLIQRASAIENVLLAIPNQRGERFFNALFHCGLSAEDGRNRAEAMDILSRVGIGALAELPSGNLSYGQQKLLSLACCLATKSSILMLDEPVAGVHPEMVLQILAVLRQIRDAGKLVIFIEHDIAAVRSVADAVIVMDEGKVISQGSPQDVLERPEIMEAYLA